MDVKSVLRREPAMRIGGSWIRTDEPRPVTDPADESTVAEAPEGDASHIEAALEAARRAQRSWGRKSGIERGAALTAVAEGIRAVNKIGPEQLQGCYDPSTVDEAPSNLG